MHDIGNIYLNQLHVRECIHDLHHFNSKQPVEHERSPCSTYKILYLKYSCFIIYVKYKIRPSVSNQR